MHATPDEGPLIAFADDNQNIYRGPAMPFTAAEIWTPLRRNLRNAREIQESLAALYRELEGGGASRRGR